VLQKHLFSDLIIEDEWFKFLQPFSHQRNIAILSQLFLYLYGKCSYELLRHVPHSWRNSQASSTQRNTSTWKRSSMLTSFFKSLCLINQVTFQLRLKKLQHRSFHEEFQSSFLHLLLFLTISWYFSVIQSENYFTMFAIRSVKLNLKVVLSKYIIYHGQS
jgi:hypothetical protein